MAKKPTFQNIRIKPLTGPMNPVAVADELTHGAFAWKENLEISKNNRLARRAGFDQFQDTDLNGVVHLDEVTTTGGVRRLIAANDSGAVSVLGSSSTSWRDMGGDLTNSNQWDSDVSGNVLVLTDGTGNVQTAELPNGSLTDLPELKNELGVSAAKVVITFSGCTFVMNLRVGGFPFTSQVRWSGLNTPTVFVSGDDNIAGFHDLPYDQTILAAGVLGDRLLIYTDSAIWACRATGTSAVFAFTQLYADPISRGRCLAHRRSLVTVGSTHVYVGQDALYTFNAYQREPLRLEWLDSAARIMFEPDSGYTLSRSACDVVTGFNSDTQELWLSWAGDSANHTLIADTRHKTCDYDSRGWGAFINHARSDQTSFGDWLDLYVPDDAELWFDIGNANWHTLCGTQLSDWCSGCDDNPLFIGSLTQDAGRLKAIGSRVSGDRILGHDLNGSITPYTSIIRGVVPTGMEDHDKVLRRFVVDVTTDANSSNNAHLQLRTGISQQAFSPNDPGTSHSGIQWSTHPIKAVGPDPTGDTLDELDGKTLLRTLPVEWNLFERGRFLYWELSVVGADGAGTVLLDLLEFSRLEFEVRAVTRR